MKDEVKIESSIPVACRISIIHLAELHKYWKGSGYRVNTMGGLVSQSIELLHSVLLSNDAIRGEMTVGEAYRYLEDNEMYQKSMKKLGAKKLAAAIRFENMRSEGVDPKIYDPRSYHVLHNENSVIKDNFETPLTDNRLSAALDMLNNLTDDEVKAKTTGITGIDIPIKEKMTESELEAKEQSIVDKDIEEADKLKNITL